MNQHWAIPLPVRYFWLIFFLLELPTEGSSQTAGCTDYEANNYNPNATRNNGSCTYTSTTYSIPLKTGLSSTLVESSGLVYAKGVLWSHNDSGGSNAIYSIDTTNGSILQTVTITNATNTDWEDMTTDGTYLYIGDFGNNAKGNRSDLKVYKVRISDIGVGATSNVVAEIIRFSYLDQTDFTAKANNSTDYDCEAFVFYQDSLHLFSKDWLDFKTRHYVMPATAGTYVAQWRETYNVNGLITAATISTANEILLLGYDLNQYITFLWKLSDFKGSQFFSGNKKRIELGSVLASGQVEGIAYKNKNAGFISCEKINSLFPQRLFNFSIPRKDRKPGSSKALRMDGINDYVLATGKDLDAGDFTLEAWLMPQLGSAGGILAQGGYSATGYFLEVDAVGSLKLETRVGGILKGSITAANALVASKWQHVAVSVTRAGTGNLTRMYVNGLLVATGDIPADDLTNTTLEVGRVYNGSAYHYYKGEIDEARIWNKALTDDTLRAWMCRKIYDGHPNYANLQSYFRFDEGTASSTLEWKANGTASLMNSPSWINSGAALGDTSAALYSTPTSLSLAHPDGDYMTVNLTTGSVDAIHLYRINEPTLGASVPSVAYELDSQRYWGVFLVGGSNPVYTATYTYAGRSDIQNEAKLGLLYRANNAASAWIGINSATDPSAHTLSLAGMTGTEYALVGDGPGALPVSFLDFTAELVDQSRVLLQWKTALEVNNAWFELERSTDGKHFVKITTVQGAGNSQVSLNYQAVDPSPVNGWNYYRLKQIDEDGRLSYSKTKAIFSTNSPSRIMVYPNPFDQSVTLQFTQSLAEPALIRIVDVCGRVVYSTILPAGLGEYPLLLPASLRPGMYYLDTGSSKSVVYTKLVKQ